MAYVLANADLRPRNGFLSHRVDGSPQITMIDYEHCLFDVALDLSDIAHPFDPRSFDGFESAEVERRATRRVLTRATMRRTRRSFIATETAPAEIVDAFRAGWLDVHERAAAHRRDLLERFAHRIQEEPFLVGGLQAHRRALGRLDVAALERRLQRGAREACEESL